MLSNVFYASQVGGSTDSLASHGSLGKEAIRAIETKVYDFTSKNLTEKGFEWPQMKKLTIDRKVHKDLGTEVKLNGITYSLTKSTGIEELSKVVSPQDLANVQELGKWLRDLYNRGIPSISGLNEKTLGEIKPPVVEFVDTQNEAKGIIDKLNDPKQAITEGEKTFLSTRLKQLDANNTFLSASLSGVKDMSKKDITTAMTPDELEALGIYKNVVGGSDPDEEWQTKKKWLIGGGAVLLGGVILFFIIKKMKLKYSSTPTLPPQIFYPPQLR